jgi:uncharacterized protein with GYD domain
MATFISTVTFTEQGFKNIADTTKRATAMKTAAKKMGVKIKDVYWTMGDHDGVLILEAPDDETANIFLLYVGTMGNVQTTTVRAYTAPEMDKILSRLHPA